MFEILLGAQGIPVGAKINYREAVRGVALNNLQKVFLIHTAKGDYKFPGGGVQRDEDHITALSREFVEETGYSIATDIELLGVISEQRPDKFDINSYFVMKSYYYKCKLIGENNGQNLENYEAELEFHPEYISFQEAYSINRKILDSKYNVNPWVEREIIALKILNEKFLGICTDENGD